MFIVNSNKSEHEVCLTKIFILLGMHYYLNIYTKESQWDLPTTQAEGNSSVSEFKKININFNVNNSKLNSIGTGADPVFSFISETQ